MGNMSPLAIDAGILLAGLLAYGLIWFVSRDLSRIAQILARVLPLVFFAPMFIVLQPHLTGLKAPPAVHQKKEKAAGPAPLTLTFLHSDDTAPAPQKRTNWKERIRKLLQKEIA